ncbi:hypothetical protein CEUSTIGMA_g6188.t1 [Chlamydomonas eustigma]|uniref:Phospholipid:diacylglycerol acyltransferase n=1 Tax=Chlamydomonas eustigma TaxID=1157962 RepID=A0A250X6P0_9CHLO|nr:hypothetical protein CEUSTIGMA_g6188.t1 [Chlamydomonas eustigma]|eukprot:GAX78751.1 hypothetical protein CEUSTIGMA_g6188.t1 [Chlamydomonas eustigma]
MATTVLMWRKRWFGRAGVVVAIVAILAGTWINRDSLEEAKLREFRYSAMSLLESMRSPQLDTAVVREQVLSTMDSILVQFGLPPTGGPAGVMEGPLRQTSGTASPPSGVGRPGGVAADRGWRAKHPVVLIPGFVTSALELWQGHECARRYFRKRMWGSLGMIESYLRDQECYFKHLSLHPETGLDPEGIKLRAAQGLESIDFFMSGYWVWAKLVESLADIGYDSNNLIAMPFDWRLAVPLLETRDAYFTKLRDAIETAHSLAGQKVVIVTHSYGENVGRAFYTSMGAEWMESHLEAVVNIAGTVLGVPKAITALLSGEMRDTAQLGALSQYLTNTLVPLESRAKLFRTWASVLSMLPVGGTKVWGNATWAPDDTEEVRSKGRTFGAMFAVRSIDSSTQPSASASPGTETSTRDARISAVATKGVEHGEQQVQPGCSWEEDGQNHASSQQQGGSLASKVMGTQCRASPREPSLHGEGRPDAAGYEVQQQQEPAAMFQAGSDSSAQGFLEGLKGLIWSASTPATDIPSSSKSASRQTKVGSSGLYSVEEAIQAALSEAGEHAGRHYSEWGPQHSTSKKMQGQSFALPDATRVPLPRAPSFNVYCLYGVGIPTERSYYYTHSRNALAAADALDASSSSLPVSEEVAESQNERTAGDLGTFNWRINVSVSDPSTGLENGVQTTDGDLTVPLISLGAMCHKGWRSKRLNPGGLRVVCREKPHVSSSSVRGGPGTAHHVDIMGNTQMILDVLAVASGHGVDLGDDIVSDIARISSAIDFETWTK